jgi:hypothetical protein
MCKYVLRYLAEIFLRPLFGYDDRLCCETIYDSFIGRVAVVNFRAVFRGSEHYYFVGRAWTGGFYR